MKRKSSRGNPWHDAMGRFCHGPEARVDTWGNEISDEQRQEAVKSSECEAWKYAKNSENRKLAEEAYERGEQALAKFPEEYKSKEAYIRAKMKYYAQVDEEEGCGNGRIVNEVGEKYYTKATAEDPPTAKQKRFATAIAKRLGKDLPEEETKKGYSIFIAENVDEFYSKKPETKPEVKPESKPKAISKPTIPNTPLIMPTQVGRGKEGAIAFTKECAEAFGAKIENVTFYSKQMGNTKGRVGGRNIDGKYEALSCTVTSKKDKEEQIHTTYHEVFHLARNGYGETDNSRQGKQVEETMAEVSATTMCNMNNIESKSTSYSEEIIKTLPRLKQSEKYKDCNTMSDFGNIFINGRRKGEDISEEIRILSNQRFSEGKYYAQYSESAKKEFPNIYENVCPTKFKDNERIKKAIYDEFESGIKKIEEGKGLNKLTRNERLLVSACIRKTMEKEGIF